VPGSDEILAQSKALHAAGQFRDAEQGYRRALQVDPNNFDAHLMLGVAQHSLGDLAGAIASLQKAVRLNPSHAEAEHYLAIVLSAARRLDEATVHYRRALQLRPDDPRTLNNLGAALVSQNLLAEAAECYTHALRINPDYAQAMINLGALLEMRGDLPAATICYERALEIKPNDTEALSKLAAALTAENRFDEAAAYYARLLNVQPGDLKIRDHLAGILVAQKKYDEAAQCFRQMLELQPDNAIAHMNLGIVLAQQGKLAEAVASCRRSVELRPDDAEAHNALGAALAHSGELDEAVAEYRQAVARAPHFAKAWCNLGVVLKRQNRLEESDACCRRAIEIDPDYAGAHHALAIALLLRGQFEEGWPEHEWRSTRMQLKDVLPKPAWTGEALPRGTIVLFSEQGLGDAMQFVRYAQQVKRLVGTVVVECQPQLAELLARCPGVDAVLRREAPLVEHDVYAQMLSLPNIFHTSLDSIPTGIPYLHPPEQLVERWRAELSSEPAFKIGIAWQGSPGNEFDQARSFRLDQFARIAALDGVRLYSLQAGPGSEQLADFHPERAIVDFGDRLGDFANTAAIVRNLDLVITCDSAPAHLAGGLGVPVWVLIAAVPDWRWMMDREDSPWYPTMRLFRQSRGENWSDVFERIGNELAGLISKRS
jgi:tetratricopeptide (TPR) repeat protein